jgi:hypothetical protein
MVAINIIEEKTPATLGSHGLMLQNLEYILRSDLSLSPRLPIKRSIADAPIIIFIYTEISKESKDIVANKRIKIILAILGAKYIRPAWSLVGSDFLSTYTDAQTKPRCSSICGYSLIL